MLTLLIFFIILSVLVLSHEFGHFIVARRAGMRVNEFGFGFPPRLWGVKKGDTTYSFNLIPFGGFVKIYGEDPLENDGSDDNNRKFTSKSKRAQAAVIVAGVTLNFILAWVLYSVGFMSGMPTQVKGITTGTLVDERIIVTEVIKDSPAEAAGLQLGDSIIGLTYGNRQIVPLNTDDVSEFISAVAKNEALLFEYTRGDIINEVSILPSSEITQEKRLIGISMSAVANWKLPPHLAVWQGLKQTVFIMWLTTTSLFELIKEAVLGQASLNDVSGPVGIYVLVGQAGQLGLNYLISLTAVLSITLGIINFFPFPALDGGRFLFLIIEAIKGSEISPTLARRLNIGSFIFLIALMLLITWGDFIKYGILNF